ncbi:MULTISPECIES: GGDEF domain-containing protein [unclassified Halomonas]|uniref:sensor domain-containing diguanylate cyclase n=1 Tax=unclassified Halomonas TaxID=2609666 RepID=UPI0007D9007A|nr:MULTISPECIES: GGDEF domain-containing protein [unclassified Halomonas]MBT2787365.1 diguanylate cyclase [Halomonas sp. ISL-106]MBT2796273.1 diguanylate cyclase [Halomonas sp. ISL-104]OAL57576.1 diguanylate cyclase [Halomonas sp. ALS9]
MRVIQTKDNSKDLVLSTELPTFLVADLLSCQTLPTLPSVAINVLRIARTEHPSVNEYANAIERDPALTMRIITLANSAFFSRSHTKVHACQEATARLGLDTTLAAVMSFSLLQNRGIDVHYQRVWMRSIIASIAARHLAIRLCPDMAGPVFTAALLQDIGIMALRATYPKESNHLYTEIALSHRQLSESERQLFGCDHSQVGAWLAAKWGVPTPLAQRISDSHGEYDITAPDRLCIQLSGPIADAWLSSHPAQLLVAVVREFETYQGANALSLRHLLENIQEQLPALADMLQMTAPPLQNNESLLAEAQQLLFQQTLQLKARLDTHQAELASLRLRQDELEERSRTDMLTGLANRSWLEEQMHKRFVLCQEQSRIMSVVFIDLDHFKKLNDQYGHQMGDNVLQKFGKTLQSLIRDGDLAGRWGGEEFLVVLPDEDAQAAQVFAKRITQRLEKTPMAHDDQEPIHVSVSIGIACLGDGGFGSADELIDAADKSMYFIKHTGRGGIAVYGDRGATVTPIND